MGLTNSQYDMIMKTYEERQYANRRALDDRRAFIAKNLPEYIEISSQISSLSVEQASKLLEGDESAFLELKNTLAGLRDKKNNILKNAGLPSDYLEMKYHCPDCKDTGYIETRKCHCFKKQIMKLICRLKIRLQFF